MMQTILGSTSKERDRRGDYRLFFTFQQFPGVFIPARIFTFPSKNKELGEHVCGMRCGCTPHTHTLHVGARNR